MDTWKVRVEALQETGILRTPRIVDAFLHVPRTAFVAPEQQHESSEDRALPFGEGQSISEPTAVATMLEAVQLQLGDRVLDVGTGSGWQAALLARIVGPDGHVHTIERIASSARAAKKRFEAHGIQNITVYHGDGTQGLPGHAPFDGIMVAAEADEVSSSLREQIAPHGRLLQPLREKGILLLEKNGDGNVSSRLLPGFIFVLLVRSGENVRKLL